MAEKWDKHLMDFLKRTGEELKTEAQRLLVEVKDPTKQAKVKEGLENLRTWAMATGKQAAERIESAVRQVEQAIEGASESREASTPGESPRTAAPPPASDAPRETPHRAEKKAAAKTGTKKSIGRKKTATQAPAKKAAAKTGTKKSIGRKKPARPAS
ncbi:transcriptional regulator [Archangium sp.]|uniref:transcriptional regulator n=1 Tax=Archangium sp. TaxID=1872627 RepID=UPI002D72524D|nr:transcriptional regulator [Archangium sp.]HYO55568.1 transcriptional regulator [Archangium sp.]